MGKFDDNRLLVLNDKHMLRVNAELATEIGLNESMVLLQLDFLLAISPPDDKHVHDGKKWIWKTGDEWAEEFPFWKDKKTVGNALSSLKAQGLILVGRFNERGGDNTLWYTLNPEGINKLQSACVRTQDEKALSQKRIAIIPKTDSHYPKNGRALPETTTENNNELNSDDNISSSDSELASPIHTPSPPTKKRGRPASSAHPETNNLLRQFQTTVGYPIDYAREGKNAKWLLTNGYTIQDVLDCYRYLKAQLFWKDKPVDLLTVKKQIGEWIKLGRPKSNGKVRPQGTRSADYDPVKEWGG